METVRDSISAYNGKARDFAECRLPYAPAAFIAIVRHAHLDAQSIVADIGAGTGHVAEPLLPFVGRLYAVEPNEGMRCEAGRRLKRWDAFHSIVGTAERTGLLAGEVDVITVGQALHWFDAPAARREFRRILKSDGWLATVWNRLDESWDPDLDAFFAPDPRRFRFPMAIEQEWEAYIRGRRSAATAPRRDNPRYTEFEREQRAAFDATAVDGIVTVRYATELAVGRVRPRTPCNERNAMPSDPIEDS